jgi:hypothetical protein
MRLNFNFKKSVAIVSLQFVMLTNANACGKMAVLSTETGNKRIELIIEENKIAKTPAWNPTMGEPPISVAKASAIALAWAKNRFKRFDSVMIREIALVEYTCASQSSRWYYRFDFVPLMDNNRVYGSGYWAALLMDGSMIQPIEKVVTPAASKESLQRK